MGPLAATLAGLKNPVAGGQVCDAVESEFEVREARDLKSRATVCAPARNGTWKGSHMIKVRAKERNVLP